MSYLPDAPPLPAVLPPLPLSDSEQVVRTFTWHNRWGHDVPYTLTTWRIFVLVSDADDRWDWQEFYCFADRGRGRAVALDGKRRLHLDLDPPRTLRFDGRTVEEV